MLVPILLVPILTVYFVWKIILASDLPPGSGCSVALWCMSLLKVEYSGGV